MSDIFSGIAAIIVGVAAAIGGLITPVNNATVSHIDSQYDTLWAKIDNISNSPYAVSKVYTSNNSVSKVVDLNVNNVDTSDLAEKADADLDRVNSSVSDFFGYNKLLPGGVYSYSYSNYMPDLVGASEREMQSAYLYCVNHEIKSGVYILDEKMPSLYDVEHPELYYGKVKANWYVCVDDLRFVFASNNYCAAAKKLNGNIGSGCNSIDKRAIVGLNEDVRRMEEYDQKVAPVTDEARKLLLSSCVNYRHDMLVRVGDVDKLSESAKVCASQLADKFGDSKYCAIVSDVYPGVKCYSSSVNVLPRVLPKTFQEWEDIQVRFGLN